MRRRDFFRLTRAAPLAALTPLMGTTSPAVCQHEPYIPPKKPWSNNMAAIRFMWNDGVTNTMRRCVKCNEVYWEVAGGR